MASNRKTLANSRTRKTPGSRRRPTIPPGLMSSEEHTYEITFGPTVSLKQRNILCADLENRSDGSITKRIGGRHNLQAALISNLRVSEDNTRGIVESSGVRDYTLLEVEKDADLRAYLVRSQLVLKSNEIHGLNGKLTDLKGDLRSANTHIDRLNKTAFVDALFS